MLKHICTSFVRPSTKLAFLRICVRCICVRVRIRVPYKCMCVFEKTHPTHKIQIQELTQTHTCMRTHISTHISSIFFCCSNNNKCFVVFKEKKEFGDER